MVTTKLQARTPGIWGLHAWPWILLLLAVSVLGFWKPYFSRLTAVQGMAHVHALMMLAWIGMLVVQPMLVRARQLAWHRRVGRASYVVVPLMVISALALAQLRMRTVPPQMLHVQQFILYLGVSASLLFVVIWGAGHPLPPRHRAACALHGGHGVDSSRSIAGAGDDLLGAGGAAALVPVDQLRRGVRGAAVADRA